MELLKLPSDIDIDTEQLCSLFDALTQELSKPFIEVRYSNSYQKKDPKEELAEIISRLHLREKDLQAAIGISRLLLDNTIMLKQQNEDLHKQIADFEDKCKSLKKEIFFYQEKHLMYEDQFEKVTFELRKAEKQINLLQKENSKMQSDNDILAQESFQVQQKATEKADGLANLLQAKLEKSYAMLNQSYGKIRSDKEELDQEFIEVRDQRNRLYKENLELTKDLKDTKAQMYNLLSHNHDLERKIEDFQEDLQTLEISNEELRKMLVCKKNDTRSVSEISKRSLLSIENELGQLEKNQDEDLEYSFEEAPKEVGNDGFTHECELAKNRTNLPLSSYSGTSGCSDNLSSMPIEKITPFGSVQSYRKSNLEDSLNSNLGLVSPSRLRAKIRKTSRSSTREAIRKTITEIERHLINRRSYRISSKISNESIFNQSISQIDKVDEADLSPIQNKEFTNFDSFSNVIELPEPETTLEQLHSPRFDMNQSEDKQESDRLGMSNVDSFSIICNAGMGSGRALEEEYFLMLTVAAKMNSKHLNDICYVSGEKLYEIARSYNIPFFKVSFI